MHGNLHTSFITEICRDGKPSAEMRHRKKKRFPPPHQFQYFIKNRPAHICPRTIARICCIKDGHIRRFPFRIITDIKRVIASVIPRKEQFFPFTGNIVPHGTGTMAAPPQRKLKSRSNSSSGAVESRIIVFPGLSFICRYVWFVRSTDPAKPRDSKYPIAPVWSRCEWVMKRYSALATCSAVRSGTRSSPSVEVPASTIKAWRPPSTKSS